MKFTAFGLSIPVCIIFAVSAPAQETKEAAVTTAAFEQLKSLAGKWEGKTQDDKPAGLTYEVVSHGTAVMEHLMPGRESDMVTIYTLEGDRIVVTHYCSAGNQPTMQTEPLRGALGKYDFSFVRVAGTKTPDEGHMVSLSLALSDKDHLTQVWTFDDHGKSVVETIHFTRKKIVRRLSQRSVPGIFAPRGRTSAWRTRS
ncbi:MAG TPA: hypothetical protein VMJ35_12890 [Dongiaceae bacterium]|nr:hypothetical protein [Dongiaceae bacterium]